MNYKLKECFEVLLKDIEDKYSKMEIGDEYVGVFNDGIIRVILEDTLKIEVLAGKPFVYDMELDLLEEEDE